MQFCVFGLGGAKNRNVGVRVFPQREEILVGGAGFGFVILGVGALLPVAAKELLEARVGAQCGEVRAGVNRGKIAVAFLECFLEFG